MLQLSNLVMSELRRATVSDVIERALGEINFGPDGLVPAIRSSMTPAKC